MGSLPQCSDPRHTARQYKTVRPTAERSDLCRGVGTRCPHAIRQPTPATCPARVCAACSPVRPGPVTTVHQHRSLSGTPSGLHWQLVCGSGPGWYTPRGRVLTQASCGSTFQTLAWSGPLARAPTRPCRLSAGETGLLTAARPEVAGTPCGRTPRPPTTARPTGCPHGL